MTTTTNGRPAPTSARGIAEQKAFRERQSAAGRAKYRARVLRETPDAILADDGSNRPAYLAWHAAEHERKRAESRAAGRDPGQPWDEFAAECDARNVHYGDSPIYAGAYSAEQFAAVAEQLRTRDRQLFSHGSTSTHTAAEVLADLDALDPRPPFSGG